MIVLGHDTRKDEIGTLDVSRARAMLICGKRGSGKSHTLGVIVEELIQLMMNVLIILVDPLGIFWTMCLPNTKEQAALKAWGVAAKGLPTRVLVPGDPTERYGAEVLTHLKHLGVEFQSLRLNPSDIPPSGWCDLFDFSINEPLGIALYRAVQNLSKKKNKGFTIADIEHEVSHDGQVQDKTREALANRLAMCREWGIFSDDYLELEDMLDRRFVNVLDLSVLDPDHHGLGNLVVAVLCRDLFRKRVAARRSEQLSLKTQARPVWLMIDEAHRFVPAGKSTLAKSILISWVKEGRQPGLSFVAATQQPSALDQEVLSQCDVIITQKLTNREDVSSLNRLSHEYMTGELKNYIRILEMRGEAVVVDDGREHVSIITVRPRMSLHGGGEIVADEKHRAGDGGRHGRRRKGA